MRKLLITGFDTFGETTVNPSWEAVKSLPDEIDGIEIEKIEIPTVYGKAAEMVIEHADKERPDAILCIGQAGGRSAITPEVIAINLREGKIADNTGVIYSGVPVIDGAPAAYFTTLPVRDMVEAIKEQGIPATLSYSAGAYVCNDTLYTLLHRYRGSDVKIGFIHVPYLPEQVTKEEPCLELETIVVALIAAIRSLK